MFRFIFLFSVIILILLANLSLAEIPKLINYQGMLTDNSGNPMNGSYNITFKIYNDPTAGTKKWEETQSSVSVTNGLFNVILGSVTPIDLDFSEDYWLDITVGAEHMPTRLRFTSVGYAYRAKIADSATVAISAPTGGGWTDDGSVVRLNNYTDNVGIGTTNPESKMEVMQGDIDIRLCYHYEDDWGDDWYGIKVTNSNSVESRLAHRWSGMGPPASTGVYGRASTSDLDNFGVLGMATGSVINYGVYGSAYGGVQNWAGYFSGNVYTGGNLGISAISPAVRLHINGGTDVKSNVENSGYVIVGSSDNDHIAIDNNEIMAKGSGTTLSTLYFQNDGGLTIFGGNVDITSMSGTTSGSTVRWYNHHLYYYSSSAKYKEDIQPLKEDFTKIMQADPKSFVDKTSGERNVGYIAEEFDQLGLGNLVTYRDGQPDAIKYELVSLYLLEVIKAQQERISSLEKQMVELRR